MPSTAPNRMVSSPRVSKARRSKLTEEMTLAVCRERDAATAPVAVGVVGAAEARQPQGGGDEQRGDRETRPTARTQRRIRRLTRHRPCAAPDAVPCVRTAGCSSGVSAEPTASCDRPTSGACRTVNSTARATARAPRAPAPGGPGRAPRRRRSPTAATSSSATTIRASVTVRRPRPGVSARQGPGRDHVPGDEQHPDEHAAWPSRGPARWPHTVAVTDRGRGRSGQRGGQVGVRRIVVQLVGEQPGVHQRAGRAEDGEDQARGRRRTGRV